jgi:hypothetical protein
MTFDHKSLLAISMFVAAFSLSSLARATDWLIEYKLEGHTVIDVYNGAVSHTDIDWADGGEKWSEQCVIPQGIARLAPDATGDVDLQGKVYVRLTWVGTGQPPQEQWVRASSNAGWSAPSGGSGYAHDAFGDAEDPNWEFPHTSHGVRITRHRVNAGVILIAYSLSAHANYSGATVEIHANAGLGVTPTNRFATFFAAGRQPVYNMRILTGNTISAHGATYPEAFVQQVPAWHNTALSNDGTNRGRIDYGLPTVRYGCASQEGYPVEIVDWAGSASQEFNPQETYWWESSLHGDRSWWEHLPSGIAPFLNWDIGTMRVSYKPCVWETCDAPWSRVLNLNDGANTEFVNFKYQWPDGAICECELMLWFHKSVDNRTEYADYKELRKHPGNVAVLRTLQFVGKPIGAYADFNSANERAWNDPHTDYWWVNSLLGSADFAATYLIEPEAPYAAILLAFVGLVWDAWSTPTDANIGVIKDRSLFDWDMQNHPTWIQPTPPRNQSQEYYNNFFASCDWQDVQQWLYHYHWRYCDTWNANGFAGRVPDDEALVWSYDEFQKFRQHTESVPM